MQENVLALFSQKMIFAKSYYKILKRKFWLLLGPCRRNGIIESTARKKLIFSDLKIFC